jgi:hypothetical protein
MLSKRIECGALVNVCAGLPASSMRKMLTGLISEREKIQVFDICMDMFIDVRYST